MKSDGLISWSVPARLDLARFAVASAGAMNAEDTSRDVMMARSRNMIPLPLRREKRMWYFAMIQMCLVLSCFIVRLF